MKVIDFKNLPDTTTPINNTNLNQMQQNVKDVFDGKEAMKSIVVEDVISKNLVKSFASANAIAQYAVSLYADFDIEPNTTYTISFVSDLSGDNFYTNEALFNSVRCVGNANGTITVTCTSLDAEKIASATRNSNGYAILKNRYALSESPTFSDVQIEPGDTFTGFVEHKEFSCGLIPKILWTNPNGTDTFGGQVITTSQDYNMYSIVFAVKIDGYYYYKSTGILPYNLRASLQSVGEGTIRRRNIENISKGSFEFNVCKDLETGSEDNADCIPIQIIGYSTEL